MNLRFVFTYLIPARLKIYNTNKFKYQLKNKKLFGFFPMHKKSL